MLLPVAIIVFAAGCIGRKITAGNDGGDAVQAETMKDSLTLEVNREILELFRQRAYEKLAAYIHPEKGVRFSAYSFVDTISDLHFSRERFLKMVKKPNELFHWGYYDGSGDSILLSWNNYAERFIYDADFLYAEKTALNEMQGFGNTINNAVEIYSGNPFVSAWFSGIDPTYSGMDWRSLTIFYEPDQGRPKIIAVVHNQWTI